MNPMMVEVTEVALLSPNIVFMSRSPVTTVSRFR